MRVQAPRKPRLEGESRGEHVWTDSTVSTSQTFLGPGEASERSEDSQVHNSGTVRRELPDRIETILLEKEEEPKQLKNFAPLPPPLPLLKKGLK